MRRLIHSWRSSVVRHERQSWMQDAGRCMRVFALCISRPIYEEFREKIFMNLPFDVGKYCLALNTRRGALHCHYFLFVMIRVQKPHGLSPHLRQCFSSRRGNELLMWCEVAAWCILSIFLSLDLGALSLIATGDLYFLSSKWINKYGPQGQTCIFYIQISPSLNRCMKYSNNTHLSSKCNCFREEQMFWTE